MFDVENTKIQLYRYERKKQHATTVAEAAAAAGGGAAVGEAAAAAAVADVVAAPAVPAVTSRSYSFKLWLPQAGCAVSTARTFGERAHSDYNWTGLDELICGAAHDPNFLAENLKAKRVMFLIMPQSADMSVETDEPGGGAPVPALSVTATPAGVSFVSPVSLGAMPQRPQSVAVTGVMDGGAPTWRAHSAVPGFTSADVVSPAAMRLHVAHDVLPDQGALHGASSAGEHVGAEAVDQSGGLSAARGGPWWGCVPLAGTEESSRITRFERFIDGLFKERKVTSPRPEVERDGGGGSTRRVPSSMLVATRVLLKARATSRTTEWAILQARAPLLPRARRRHGVCARAPIR